MAKYRYAKTDFVVRGPLGPLAVHRGEVWDATDPVVTEHADMFATQPTLVRRTSTPIEQATAAPGEKRG